MKTPTLNVNLKPCVCPHASFNLKHWETCDGQPILIPCPIPRSVVFEVVLGCDCLADDHLSHRQDCRSRPVKVACSISGKTWEESEVEDVETYPRETMVMILPNDMVRARDLCRERWALVKALVLGKPQAGPGGQWIDGPTDLFTKRDAVFAALADMARAEDAARAAEERVPGAIRASAHGDYWHTAPSAERPSAALLERYVDRLVEQVGVLP